MSSVLLPIPGKHPAENPFAVCSAVEQYVLTECSSVFSCLHTDANQRSRNWTEITSCSRTCSLSVCSLQLAQEPKERV